MLPFLSVEYLAHFEATGIHVRMCVCVCVHMRVEGMR